MRVHPNTVLVGALAAVIYASGLGSAARADCPCNGNVNGDTATNLLDMTAIAECVSLGDCDECSADCDVNCDEAIDYIDMGVAACQFLGHTDCCNATVGACTGAASFPACIVTLEDACDMFGGTFAGVHTICVGDNAVAIPAVSFWGLVVLALSLATAATVAFDRQRVRLSR